jgi:GNAT superfamily N-acetyltransferase
MPVHETSTILYASGHSFQLVQAGAGDVELIRQMLVEAAEWMQGEGIEQWKPEQFTVDEIMTYFEYRMIFLALDGEKPAGMFTLQDTDPSYWKTNDDPNYYYLHRLTVSLPYRRFGLGTAFLDWASNKASSEGKKGLRLDCRRSNLKLNRFYQKQGFKFMGVTEKQEQFFNLYER